MPRLFKRCLAIVNGRSGSRDARAIYASALQQYLDRAGIVHRDVHVPEQDTVQAIHSAVRDSECIIVCGGDGTVSSVVNVLATAAAQCAAANADAAADPACTPGPSPHGMNPFLHRPLVVVPAGLQNSVAHSLGIQSAERAVSAFVLGRQEAIPLWEVRLNGALVRYVCSYVAVGYYAEVVRRFHALDAVGDEYVALPMLTSKFTAAALYTSAMARSVACSAELTQQKVPVAPPITDSPFCSSPSVSAPGSADTAGWATEVVDTPHTRRLRYASPVRMLLAAQMPLQHGNYSLCPSASFKSGSLAATVATTEASRLRMWHLFRREAAEGYVLNEDGVHTHNSLSRVEVVVMSETHGKDVSDGERSSSEVVVALDGEMMHVPSRSRLTVHRAPFDLPFLVC